MKQKEVTKTKGFRKYLSKMFKVWKKKNDKLKKKYIETIKL